MVHLYLACARVFACLISDPAPRDATRVFFKQRDWGTHTHVEGYKRANGKRQAQGKHKASTRFQAHPIVDYLLLCISTHRHPSEQNFKSRPHTTCACAYSCICWRAHRDACAERRKTREGTRVSRRHTAFSSLRSAETLLSAAPRPPKPAV